MIPSVDAQLTAVIRRLRESVLPAVPAEDTVARQHVETVLAALKQVRREQAISYRYAVVENTASRALLSAMLSLAGDDVGEEVRQAARVLERQPSPNPDEGIFPIADLDAATAALKQMVEAVQVDAGRGPHAAALASLLRTAAREQIERELSLTLPDDGAKGMRDPAAVLGVRPGDSGGVRRTAQTSPPTGVTQPIRPPPRTAY